MADPRGPKCKICRKAGEKIFLKGIRCHTAKCPFEKSDRAPRPPGMHRFRRGKPSDYAIHLRGKQKLKDYYGVGERQFARTFHIAERQAGNTGANLLVLLERRLDNVLTICGFAASRAEARQVIIHGRVFVNGHKVDKPSTLVDVNDVVSARPRQKDQEALKVAYAANEHKPVQPEWISVKEDPPEMTILRLPTREEVSAEVDEQLVVEIESR
ncbi:MAG TPA: 30S ribosomal protein S4 [Candidatus Brocadiia bacterium]|nr:30S ribosomal protein S4 [Candidatus Brocadiia bacterium]